MSSFANTSNFDNLMLQTLLGRLQIGAPNAPNNPLLSRSLEDLLLDAANGFSDDNSEDENSDDNRTQLAKEESKLEKEIIRIILSGKADSLKPNSGQAITISDHHICVGFHDDKGSEYRVWEWHGHIMVVDDENEYSAEYIYGNYFERLQVKSPMPAQVKKEKEEEEEEEEDTEEEKAGNLGLRELIDGGDSRGARILHRNINAGSPSPRLS